MTRSIDPECDAFQAAIAVLGRPWTALILSVLREGPLRFGEIEERARGVGTRTLSARLRELERRGIVNRRVDTGPPVRVAYELTAKGQAFEDVAAAIQRWGEVLVERQPWRARRSPSSSGQAK